jgi:RNA polymerase sigma-70 factor (ECF subfamily)
MSAPPAPPATDFLSAEDRNRLVRLCARLSGSPSAAEDLAQETLLEAWKSRGRLRSLDAKPQWLGGIARNVCKRRQRKSAGADGQLSSSLTLDGVELQLTTDTSLDVQLERSEISDLLARGLSLLPPGSRDLLVDRYVRDLPVTEIAARRSMAPGTTGVALHRGKLRMRRLLQTELREDAVALGLVTEGSKLWQSTTIWCPLCGVAHLEAHHDLKIRAFAVRCPACRHLTSERGAAYLRETTGFWRTLLRVNRAANEYYRAALASGFATCDCCGADSPLRFSIPRTVTGLDRDLPGVHVRCHACSAISAQPDVGLALTHPAVQRFWRTHKRMRLARHSEVVSGGREAILVRFESVPTAARIEVVAAAETFKVLHVEGAGITEVESGKVI